MSGRPSVLASVLLVACAGPAPRPPAPAQIAGPITSAIADASDESQATSAPAAPVEAGAPSMPLRSVTFCPVASGDLTLFPLTHEGLLIAGTFPYAVCDATGRCEALPLTMLDALGSAVGDSVTAAAGTWGRDAWLTSFRTHVEGSLGWTVRYDGHAWRPADRTVAGWRHVEILLAASSDGTVVGAATSEIDGLHATSAQMDRPPRDLYELEMLSGPRARLPRLGPADFPAGLLALAHRQVVVVVGTPQDGLCALRSGNASRIVLPAAPGCDPGYTNPLLAGLDDGPVYAAGVQVCGAVSKPWLVRIEAASATALDVPEGVAPFQGLAVTHDGALWLGAGDAIVVRSVDGSWARALLPAAGGQPCRPYQVVARTDADIFVSALCGKNPMVFRTACPSPVLPPY